MLSKDLLAYLGTKQLWLLPVRKGLARDRAWQEQRLGAAALLPKDDREVCMEVCMLGAAEVLIDNEQSDACPKVCCLSVMAASMNFP